MDESKVISSNLYYSKKSLLEGEEIIAAAKWSKFAYVIPVLVGLLIFAMMFMSCAPSTESSSGSGGFITLLLLLILVIWIIISIRHSEFVITNKRIIVKGGVIICSAFELKVEMLESVNVYQGILGQTFHFGTIGICGIGASRCFVHFIDHPLEFRQKFYKKVYYNIKPVDSQDKSENK